MILKVVEVKVVEKEKKKVMVYKDVDRRGKW